MGGKSFSSKLGFALAFLLFVSVFQLLMANEEAKPTELNVLQLPISKGLDSEALDEVFQGVTTRYDQSYHIRPGKIAFCLWTRYCTTDSDCEGARCGPRCKPTYNQPNICAP
ncbi:hypothetical protein K7X08_016892 [Anisodus acutangulus]|uniref:Uncharacterized protein n=1 Tax=Anisodus acutangulus TaxID=402998 RepID=A0A9Q1LSF8_9SOLA|nr:hypothetical protein K7X08_016892 [Anisodus acutangulus]